MTFLSAGIAMTRATIHRVAQTYVAAGFQRAEFTLEQALVNDLQQGAAPSPLPTFTPLPPVCVDSSNPCRYQTSETIAVTQTSQAAMSTVCDTTQTNCASNEQANSYVNESRVTARIGVNVIAADGSTLATRSVDVILRMMKTPPYFAIAGTRDATFDDVAAGNASGDDGGITPATPNPCATAALGTTDDTAVRVAYRNQITNACSDGSSWRTASYNSNSGVQGWSQ
jgi:hypothetical protein